MSQHSFNFFFFAVLVSKDLVPGLPGLPGIFFFKRDPNSFWLLVQVYVAFFWPQKCRQKAEFVESGSTKAELASLPFVLPLKVVMFAEQRDQIKTLLQLDFFSEVARVFFLQKLFFLERQNLDGLKG